MFSVVTGDPREIADEMLTNPDVDLVTFTGGVPIGKYIAAKAVYKRQVLELGGNDPIIVMEDADLDEAATLAAAGSYKNSGQRCTAVKRMLVHEQRRRRVRRAAAREDAARGRTATRWTRSVDMGTVIDEAAREVVRGEGRTTRSRAARSCSYGNVRRGALYSPTVLDHVDPDMHVVKHETFGPVSPVIRFRTSTRRSASPTAPPTACRRRCAPTASTTSRASSPSSTSARVNVREVPGLPARADAVRRHQGLGPRLQGRRAGSDEELHQHQDVLAAMVTRTLRSAD